MKTTTFLNNIILSTLCLAALTNCTGKGGSVTGTGTTATGDIAVTKIYPTSSGPNWTPIISSGRYFIKGLNITVSGTCARGIASVEISDGVTTFTPITCTNAAFSFSHTYTGPEEGDKTLSLVGLDINSAPIAGVTDSEDIRIDNTAPAQPVVTTNGGANLAVGSAALTVNGTVDADVETFTSSSAGTVTAVPGSGTFSQAITMTSGESRIITYTAYDMAGNAAPIETFQVTYLTSLNMILSNLSSSGTDGTVTGSGGATLELRAATLAPVGSTSSQLDSSPSTYKKNLGLSNISSRTP